MAGYLMITKWDKRFLDLAKFVSTWSKDPSTQVGCVITRPDKTVASLGFNGFPRGIEDKPEWLNNREEKYKRVIHGEMNAILNAREPLHGYTIYVYPGPISCDRCTVHIIQAGIKRLVGSYADPVHAERWAASMELSKELYKEAGIRVDIEDFEVTEVFDPIISETLDTPESFWEKHWREFNDEFWGTKYGRR